MNNQNKTIKKGIILIILFLLMINIAIALENKTSLSYFEIDLISHIFTPDSSFSKIQLNISLESNKTGLKHALLQIESKESIVDLSTLGVEFLDKINSHTYVVSIPINKISDLNKSDFVLWVGDINSQDKLSKGIFDKEKDGLSKSNNIKFNIPIECFSDIDRKDCVNIIENYGEILKGFSGNLFFVNITIENVLKLSNDDSIAKIGEISGTAVSSLSQASPRIKADVVQTSPYNLDGENVKVAMWEALDTRTGGYHPRNHSAFDDRLSYGDTFSSNSGHATRVAGIVVGDGTGNPSNKGIAPAASLKAYSEPDDTPNEYNDAIDLGYTISQNSWNYFINESASNCHWYGLYDAYEKIFDEYVRGDEHDKPILIVFSAGNDRNLPNCGNDNKSGYNTTKRPATAKNILTVGASFSDSDSVACFSGWGPTDDGRIKPEVVAPGDSGSCSNGWGITSTIETSNTAYSSIYGEGTSFAAPIVSGIAALLTEQYRITYNQFFPTPPLPSTTRALLIHAATDLYDSGPDYKTGFGRVDANKSVNLIIDQKLLERQFTSQGQTHDYNITVSPNDPELKITLVWDDDTDYGYSNPLVNDLDMVLISPNEELYYPYLLDPSQPNLSATRGQDHINVIEQISIDNPTAGEWILRVNATDLSSTQSYSLVGTHLGYKKIFFINNEGNQDLSISSITTSDNWLSIDKNAFTVSSGESELITASIDTEGMTAGTYHANITINSNDGDESSLKIPIVLDLSRTDADGDGYYSNSTGGNDPDDNDPNTIPAGALVEISISISSLDTIYSNNNHKIFEAIIHNDGDRTVYNVSFIFDFGDGNSIISLQNISQIYSDERVYLYVEHNYSSNGEYDIRINATGYSITENASAILESNIFCGELFIDDFSILTNSEKNVIFKSDIVNTGLSTMNNLNWTFDFNDTNIFISTKDFNLSSNETIYLIIEYNYDNYDNYTPVLFVQNSDYSYIKYLNITISNATESSDLTITSFKELYSMGKEKVFEIKIKATENQSNVYWNVTGLDSPIYSSYPFNLTVNETINILIHNNFSNYDTYTLTATARSTETENEKTLSTKGKEVEVSNLNLLYENSLTRIFEFFVTNTYTSLLNNLNFTFNTGENMITSGNFNLSKDESIRILIEKNYSSSSQYNTNATVISSLGEDSENLTIGG